MPSLALATDYDGTLAENGRVTAPTIAAMRRFRESGRKLLLVTGRELEELLGVFPDVALFDRVVAENGAILYQPVDQVVRALAEPPPPEFVANLTARGVAPISVGRVVVATWQPHEEAVRQVIRELGLDLEVILNKRSVMALPRGVHKASGLLAAIQELGLLPGDLVGVGDAENDLDFLALCGFSAAVSNALDSVKAHADWITTGSHGQGVIELIERLESATWPASGPRR
jgi:HAD superfamily hydrolase (TIGR01484 family)